MIHPNATEYCDEVDNSDGQIDNNAYDALRFYLDEDGDGTGLLDKVCWLVRLQRTLWTTTLIVMTPHR